MTTVQSSGSGITFLLAVALFFRQWEVPSGSGNFLTRSGNALCILFLTDKKEEEAKVVKDDHVHGRDLEEESTAIIPADTMSKDKGKGIMVEEPKPLKKKQQVEMDEEYTRKLHAELNKDIDWDVAIEHVKQKAKEDPAMQRYQIEEEERRALQNINETLAQKSAKMRKLNEEVEDLKKHLEIVPDEDDNVYTEATPLARKNYNMHNIGKTIVKLHAMLKLHKKGTPKKAETLVVLAIREAGLKKGKNASIASTSGIFTIELYAFPNKTWVYDTSCGTHICSTSQGLRGCRKLKHGSLSLTWMAFEGNTRDLGSFREETDEITDQHRIFEEVLLTKHGDGVTSIKQRGHDLFSEGVWNLETVSGRRRHKEDLESST
nr:zinc finger, CCHC-type [Tanacetum cinerariifolium]